MGQGSTFTAISRADLETLDVPVAPPEEQHRIVAKIERLFEQSRTAREALDGVPALMKRFRQSVLASAFRGELTERDPNDEPASVLLERIRAERLALAKSKGSKKYVEPEPPDTSDLPELPDGWCWATLESLAETGRVTYGVVKRGEHVPNGIPVVQIRDIVDSQIHIESMMQTSPEIAKDYQRTSLQGGEIVLAIRGTVGRTAIVPNALAGGNVSREIALIPVLGSLSTEYVKSFIDSEFAQNRLKKDVKGVAVTGINIADLRLLPVPLAPLAEQRRIVAKVEALFAQADAIERAVEVARRRSEKVDQAILARAFQGKLVPQNPDDEPVSVLLGRIQQEREQTAREAQEARRIQKVAKSKTVGKPKSVLGPTELTDLLKQLQGKSKKPVSPQTLWLESGLGIDDFYYYLKQEVMTGRIRERRRGQDVHLEVIP